MLDKDKHVYRRGVAKAGLGLQLLRHVQACSHEASYKVTTRKHIDVPNLAAEDIYRFQFSLNRAGGTASSPQPLAFCLLEARVVLSGEMLVVGVKISDTKPLIDQLQALEGMAGMAYMEPANRQENFAMVLTSGDLALLPVGYIFVMYSSVETLCVRWSYNVLPNKNEDNMVSSVLAKLMEAQPGFREGTLNSFYQHLSKGIAKKS